jgi:hypothetical protein
MLILIDAALSDFYWEKPNKAIREMWRLAQIGYAPAKAFFNPHITDKNKNGLSDAAKIEIASFLNRSWGGNHPAYAFEWFRLAAEKGRWFLLFFCERS